MARVASGASITGVNGALDDPITQAGTALADFDTAGADAVTALGVITYSATTHQFSGTFVSGPSPTAANLNTMVTALNTALAALAVVGANAPDLFVSINPATIKDRSMAFRFAHRACKFIGVLG